MLKYFKEIEFEAGTDEAGRGCLAGPVTAAAVILPISFADESLNDSKKLSPSTRNKLRPIIEVSAICYGVAHIETDIIDTINILNASILAMHKAINKLSKVPDFLIVDGNRFKPINDIPYKCIVKGDSKFQSIAAASILAKTYRDAHMEKIHEEFPMYNWKQNKGYGTEEHRQAIIDYGITKYHRKSFKLLPHQLKLNL
ncbi:MAG: ribonuclease HII [Eudoraea sp.]|uniref:ribonuclease HII n=1 Tax=Eudoraea sp. TaxID=1979955 RepID=UPI003C75E72D